MQQQPTLESHPATGDLRAIALFCHGGTATSVRAAARLRALPGPHAGDRAVRPRHDVGDRGVATYLLRYRVAGWNGAAADAHADVRWAIEQLRAEHGPDVPIVLVGHSMGGRAALRAGGDAAGRGRLRARAVDAARGAGRRTCAAGR